MNKEFKNPGMMRVPSDLEMPKGHEGYSLQDKEKCPYFQIQEKTKDQNPDVLSCLPKLKKTLALPILPKHTSFFDIFFKY